MSKEAKVYYDRYYSALEKGMAPNAVLILRKKLKRKPARKGMRRAVRDFMQDNRNSYFPPLYSFT